ncbi:MAG TPA: alpha/beta fold hydrolase [Chloroflexota bacterium]
MATFVLVQGAIVGSWCWRWVTPELRDARHVVYTPSLTGLGERVHLASPQVDLDTHIEDVVNVLHYEDLTGVVLVGWSYGGMIIAGATDRVPERVAHVVYLDSDVPRDGDTSAPLSAHARLEALARIHGDGWRVPPEVTSAESRLLSDLSEERRRWIAARFAPHPVKTWLQPIRLSGRAATILTTYIRCTVGYDPTDEDTARQDARIRSEPHWRYWELPASHSAPFSAPYDLAQLLLKIV